MNKLRAFTLVEMIAVMSVGSVLLVLAGSLVHRSMRLDSNWREQGDARRALSRLSHDVRNDLHRATRAEVSQDPLMLIVTQDDGEVNYTVTEREVIRELKPTTGQIQREFYKKPAEYQVEMTALTGPARINLVVTRAVPHKEVRPRIVLHLEPEIGRLKRITETSEVTP